MFKYFFMQKDNKKLNGRFFEWHSAFCPQCFSFFLAMQICIPVRLIPWPFLALVVCADSRRRNG